MPPLGPTSTGPIDDGLHKSIGLIFFNTAVIQLSAQDHQKRAWVGEIETYAFRPALVICLPVFLEYFHLMHEEPAQE